MIKKYLCLLFLASLINSNCPGEVTEFVDPHIGNIAPLLVPTFPTFHLPNQMVRMVPGRRDHTNDQINYFPMHLYAHRFPGLFRMIPGLGEVDRDSWNKKMFFDHDLEIMHPWMYSTYLLDEDITVSFAPGEKTAIFKINFPETSRKHILIQGSKELKFELSGNNSIEARETIVYKLRGTTPKTRTMYVYNYIEITDVTGNPIKGFASKASEGRLQLVFPEEAPQSIVLKYAISYISQQQAKANFQQELAATDFVALAARGKKVWQDTLSRIEVTGGTEDQLRSFYTALYRTHERMVDINEGGRYYSGYDGEIHESERPFYVDDWIWDSYLAHHPLRTILDPEMQNDILNSYTLMYQQSGWMPTFPQVLGNHMCMFAYHSCAIFLDGYRKGLRDYDLTAAYEGIKKNLTQATALPWRQGLPTHELDEFYHEHGFYPALRAGEEEPYPMVDGFEKRQPVAVTLGMSYDAWVAAELAKILNRQEDYEIFSQKARNYKNLWHADMRLFMPKDDQGEWIMIDPKLDGGPGYRNYYDENNGWTYAWSVQHDIDGLINLLGGKQAAEARLDQMFREPLGLRKRDFYVDGSNSTGLIGQFSMGNEPSFHIPYLYNYFGAPWKTQNRTRYLLDVWFNDTYHGIPGDEDGGGMTAFVVLSSIGLYQVTPGLPYYTITSPIFERTTIQLQNGKEFVVDAPGASKQNKYIQRAFINGKELESPFISHDQIMQGGILKLELSNRPNKDWGKDSVPPVY